MMGYIERVICYNLGFLNPGPVQCSDSDRSSHQTHLQVDTLHVSVAFKQELGHGTL